MRRLILSLFALSLGIAFGVHITGAQDDLLYHDCVPQSTTNLAYSQTMELAYEADSQRVVLRNIDTHATAMVLEQNFVTSEFNVFRWSPDCHYISAWVRRVNSRDSDVFIWDVVSGTRVTVFENIYRIYARPAVVWSPHGDKALVRTTAGHFIWDATTNSSLLLVYNSERSRYRELHLNPHWDYARGWVMLGGTSGVSVFDLHTGVELQFLRPFSSASYGSDGFGYIFSQDNGHVVIYGSHWGLGVYDLNTFNGIDINTEATTRNDIAFSPDNRYIVIVRNYIRVWDLQNLPESFEDRLPVFRYEGPLAILDRVRFIDSTTIETVDVYRVVQRWNILTGEEVALP